MDWAPLLVDQRRDDRFTAEAEASLSSPSAPSSDASLGYDAQSRVKSMTTVTDGRTTNYTYYKDDLLHQVVNPNGDVATSTYDDAGRIDTLVTANGATTVSSYDYGYDTNGNRTSQIETLRKPDGSSTTETTGYAYDAANRLKRVTYPADATYPQGRVATYTYDKAGNREGERETTISTVPPTTEFPNPEGSVIIERIGAFDANNRLSSLSSSGVSSTIGEDTRLASYAFTYDNNGNEVQRTSTTQHTPDPQGEPRPATVVTTNSTYDLSDRLVEQGRTVAEQVEGNPVEATVIIARHEYDGEGRRTKKIGEEGIRQYVYDDTSILAEYDTNGLEIAKYDYGADRLIRLTRTDEGTRYFSFDGLGSVTSLTTLSGTVAASYRLDAWGQFRFEADLAPSKNRFGYTGHYWDKEASLYYAKARYYDPFTARFTQSDSFLGNIDDPPSLHRYFYANANPTFYTDPTGNYSWSEAKSDVQWVSNFSNSFQREYATRFGEGVANIATVGGYGGVKRAYAEGRVTATDGWSGLRAYNEGVASFATFGAVDGLVEARAGEGKGVGGSVLGAGLGVVKTFVPIDETRTLLSAEANEWEKAEALATGVSKIAGLLAGGLSARGGTRAGVTTRDASSVRPITVESSAPITPPAATGRTSRYPARQQFDATGLSDGQVDRAILRSIRRKSGAAGNSSGGITATADQTEFILRKTTSWRRGVHASDPSYSSLRALSPELKGTFLHSSVQTRIRQLRIEGLSVNERLYGTSPYTSPSTGLPYEYRIPDFMLGGLGGTIFDIKPRSTPLGGPQFNDFRMMGRTNDVRWIGYDPY